MLNLTCRNEWCQQPFTVTDEDLAFYDKVSPSFADKKVQIAPPTLCSQCRLQRRLAFRNQIYVYTRNSSVTGKQIFSMYTPEAPRSVVENEIWYGDSWDAMEYGQDLDLNEPIFPQLEKLFSTVPVPARALIGECVNSEYSNNSTSLKNCYLVFNASYAEDCMYCESLYQSKDCMDCTRAPNAELCFDSCASGGSYNVQSSHGARNCTDCFFVRECLACKHCFCCVNLCRKEYCIFNEQKTKEEYEVFMRTVNLQSYEQRQGFKKKLMELALSQPQPELLAMQSEDVSGNYISNCKSVHESYFMRNGENNKYCFGLDDNAKDCMDVALWGDGLELAYESALVGSSSSNLLFCYYLFQGNSNLIYCTAMMNCEDCFGCSGLKRKRYCVFNKQYTKEEYEVLVPKIIELMSKTGEWGEYFPLSMSPIPYNQSLAGRYYPRTKEDVIAAGSFWHEDYRENEEGIPASELLDCLPTTDDAIIVRSMKSGRSFKITSQEIKRYRQFNVPLPRLTYDERMEERILSMGGLKLYSRMSDKSGQPICTTIPPQSPYKVWTREEWDQEFWT